MNAPFVQTSNADLIDYGSWMSVHMQVETISQGQWMPKHVKDTVEYCGLLDLDIGEWMQKLKCKVDSDYCIFDFASEDRIWSNRCRAALLPAPGLESVLLFWDKRMGNGTCASTSIGSANGRVQHWYSPSHTLNGVICTLRGYHVWHALEDLHRDTK